MTVLLTGSEGRIGSALRLRLPALRIGTFAERSPDQRSLASWLSPADCARLVDACLRSPELDYALIWGISANRDRWWSSAAGERLGYHPQDYAGQYRPPDLDAHSAGSLDLVGGGYTDAGSGIDERAGEIA